MTGYVRYLNDYIIQIEVLDHIDGIQPGPAIVDKEHAVHCTQLFKVVSILNWVTGEQINSVDRLKIGNIYDWFERYTLYEEGAIFNYYGSDSDEKIYLKKKSGVFTGYGYDGGIIKQYFHNNGIKEGVEKIYRDRKLTCENNYIGGKLNGKSTSYLNGEEKVTFYCDDVVVNQ